ncbi:MAG: hypothetical protein GY828_00995 [Candidatus Gracilibacteria bacterium]|nr:hypothetical protein [Candidatus Gracilibacteria bacterium]
MNTVLDYDFGPLLESFYQGITFVTVFQFMLIYFFIIWIALIVWVIKDINNRTQSILFQLISILIIFLGTPLGVFIYLLIRPSKTIFEKYHAEVENNLDLMQEIINEKNNDIGDRLHCFVCETPVLPEFKFCPKCEIQLKQECHECTKTVYRNWEICPYCGIKQDFQEEKTGNKKQKKKKEETNENKNEEV